MPEELGRIDRPPVEDFRRGRKLFLVPLVFNMREPDPDYLERYRRYWEQVESQLSEFELKLGSFSRVYHELISGTGEDALQAIKELNQESGVFVQHRLDKGAKLEPPEDPDVLTEYTDWSRCLSIGFENDKVFTIVFEAYREAGKKRNEIIARRIDETLKADEIGVLLIREGHQVQFPPDIHVFYVAPPALDVIHRWLRDQREKPGQAEPPEETAKPEQ